MNAAGTRWSMRLSGLLALVSLVPLALILLGPAVKPSTFDAGRILPFALPESGPDGDALGVAALVAKWLFVAAWAAYGAEMSSALCAEIRTCRCDIRHSILFAAVACFLAFALVPTALVGVAGASGIAAEPTVAFLPAARVLFGGAGVTIVALVLAFGLILGAQAFVLSSSRTIYQLALDGHLPRAFARVNGRGAPVGSMVWDGAVIGLMLLVFRSRVVEVVAAANVGYLIVFVLMPLAYVRLRERTDGDPNGFRLYGGFRFVAYGLALFNAAILFVGGAQWGAKVMLVGFGVSLSVVPISILTRLGSRRGLAAPIASAAPPR